MEKNKAIVIGALGQDGSFMCDILLEKGYDVYGIVKPDTDDTRLRPDIKYFKKDINDIENLKNIFSIFKPKHVYNFMGVTDIFDPWSNGDVIYDNNFLIPVKIIEAIKATDINIKFLQASSSLVFGLTMYDSPQNENTFRKPIYHYGVAKNFTDSIIKLYREKYNMNLHSAILYPHESERRRDNFFTKKLINTAIDIKLGLKDTIEVGDINGFRDIGYAKDYMYACYLMMTADKPDDYIIGTGKSTKTIDFIKLVFEKLDLPLENKLIIKDNLKRDTDLSHLIADISKIKKLGWEPTNNINDIIDIMIKDKMKI